MNTSTIENESNPETFVSQDDYRLFAQNGRDLDACIVVFLTEMREYYNLRVQDKYIIKEPLESLEQFNREHLLGYPSSGGDAVWDDLFTGPECPIEIFTKSSRDILAHFYKSDFTD